MRLVTERDLIRQVARRWRTCYPAHAWPDKQDIAVQLTALDPETATSAQVTAIIGNSVWTTPDDCDDCDAKNAAVIMVGEEPDYESATAYLCAACVRKAFKLVKELPK